MRYSGPDMSIIVDDFMHLVRVGLKGLALRAWFEIVRNECVYSTVYCSRGSMAYLRQACPRAVLCMLCSGVYTLYTGADVPS